MDSIFADRMQNVPRSFIREILKVSLDPQVISFAGGLPNPDFFPVKELEAATAKVFAEAGSTALQYSNSEGNVTLREQIAQRYKKQMDIDVSVEDILVTCGSQQGLDLIGKIFVNDHDPVLIEEPGYLGAIQALSVFRPKFVPVPLVASGVDCEKLEEKVAKTSSQLFYCVPCFQNPSGLSYTEEVVQKVSELAEKYGFYVVEDNPYGELRFRGQAASSFYKYIPERTILLGTFSKIVAPGFRLGWIAAPSAIREKLLVAKQASDLHTSNIGQMIISQYLADNDLDGHLNKIKKCYGDNCKEMERVLKETFPGDVTFTSPDGGMFLWGQLPEGMEAMKLFDYAVKEKAVYVPGEPFYTTDTPTRSFRLSYSCVDSVTIKEGLERFARAYKAYKASL